MNLVTLLKRQYVIADMAQMSEKFEYRAILLEVAPFPNI